VYVDEPRNRELALAVRDAWRAIGIETTIRARPEETYLTLPGPLSETSVDVHQADVRYPFADAYAGLGAWTCDADENRTNFCDVEYDALMARARREPDPAAREELYEAAEEILSGDEGDVPAVAIFWHTSANLESLNVKESFTINPLGQIDLSAVETG
jgi:ABC-type transport system substrate-binding protein